MHLCVLLVFLLLFSASFASAANAIHWIQISFFDFTCLLRDNQYYSCIVCLFWFLFRSLPIVILFVCFTFVNNLRAINLTFLARLFTCFETWSGIAGFMFRLSFCFGFVFLLAKIIVPMGLVFNWFFVCLCLCLTISFHCFAFFACCLFGVLGFFDPWRADTHTELLGLLLQVL